MCFSNYDEVVFLKNGADVAKFGEAVGGVGAEKAVGVPCGSLEILSPGSGGSGPARRVRARARLASIRGVFEPRRCHRVFWRLLVGELPGSFRVAGSSLFVSGDVIALVRARGCER